MAIATTSREMGSGGIPIAQQAAEELEYTLIDGSSIQEVASDYDLTAADDRIKDIWFDNAGKS